MLTPVHYGLPSRFTAWRPGQLEAIDQIYLSPARFVVLCAPTGFGKSLVVEAAAQMIGWPTCVLTATKGLQDQYMRDFGEVTYDLRGKSNFKCPIWRELELVEGTSVSEAPCNFGYRCKHKQGGCQYFDRYREAQRAHTVVTNYQCWLHDQKKAETRGGNLEANRGFGLLVLDEAHQAPEELAGYLEVELGQKECERAHVDWPFMPGTGGSYTFEQWVQWAGHWHQTVLRRVEEYEGLLRAEHKLSGGEYRDAGRQKAIERKLGTIAAIRPAELEQEWVMETNEEETEAKFAPLWPHKWAEQELFRGAKKVVLVSATVRPKTLDLLGIAKADREFVEYASGFPVARRPVTHVKCVQMRYSMPESDLELWLQKIDNILTGRPGRKGLIHTVSYQRTKWLLERSRHRGRMLTHSRWDKADVVARFKRMPESTGAVLVSPSLDTGYDFPDEEARFQVIAKVPFPDLRSAVQRARMEVDKSYRNYVTAQDLVQMCGRIVRSETDWGETFIVDDQVTWFVRQAGEYLPEWWKHSYSSVASIPRAMEV